MMLSTLAVLISSCAYPERTGFNRATSSYAPNTYTPSLDQSTSNNPRTGRSGGSLDRIIKPWLGSPYRIGGSTRKGTDCSGFVMNIMREWRGIKLPHGTKPTWKMGKSISRGDLEPGDVLFFGSWWGVNHNAVYVGNNRFAHASSSQGVIYTFLDDPYWDDRYKGARRY